MCSKISKSVHLKNILSLREIIFKACLKCIHIFFSYDLWTAIYIKSIYNCLSAKPCAFLKLDFFLLFMFWTECYFFIIIIIIYFNSHYIMATEASLGSIIKFVKFIRDWSFRHQAPLTLMNYSDYTTLPSIGNPFRHSTLFRFVRL